MDKQNNIQKYICEKVDIIQSSPIDMFPADLIIISNAYSCNTAFIKCKVSNETIECVPVFRTVLDAIKFVGECLSPNINIKLDETTFENARLVAKQKPETVKCLALFEDNRVKMVHYIR